MMAEPSPGRRSDLRRDRADDLGLRRALGDRVLPLLVAAMAFLAALAGAGAVGARALARHWQTGAEATLTVQVPRPQEPASGVPRLQRALALLQADPAVAGAQALDAAALDRLLAPWFGPAGTPPGLTLPGVVAVQLAPGSAADVVAALGVRLAAAVPDAQLESHAVWLDRLAALANSLQACAWLALTVVVAVAVLVVAVATRSGLVARREAIRIVHGLGATDGYIATRFARRATALAASGGALGALAVLPVLLGLAALVAPFAGSDAPQATAAASGRVGLLLATSLPAELWLALPALPAIAALIGFVTAQGTVRRWLRRLP